MAGVVAALVAGTVGGLPALGASASTAPLAAAPAPVAMGGSFPNAVCGCTSPTSATTPGAAMKVQYVKVLVR